MDQEHVSPLKPFIEASKKNGASDEALAAILMRQGWAESDVYQAIGEYWATTTGIPVPTRGRKKESSREAFLYLLAFSTLCGWATALGSALFTYIKHWFPEAVEFGISHYFSTRSVTSEMATMAVTFPIFMLVMRAIIRESSENPEQLHSGVRKWLTYIALLGTAAAMIGDLIWFLTYLLQGEITTRFFLKSAVVMLICGSIFIYYLRFLQPPEKRTQVNDKAWNRTFMLGSLASVLVVFLLGFVVAGTPSQLREQQADRNRIDSLRQIANTLHARYQNQNRSNSFTMPDSLQQLVEEKQLRSDQILDKVTRTPYTYTVIEETKYSLCAEFQAESNNPDWDRDSPFWQHPAGKHCFELDASQGIP